MKYLYEWLEFLKSAFDYDMYIFSKGWVWYSLLIPAIFYFIFFIIKWCILIYLTLSPIFIIENFLLKLAKIVFINNDEEIMQLRTDLDNLKKIKDENNSEI